MKKQMESCKYSTGGELEGRKYSGAGLVQEDVVLSDLDPKL